MGSRMCCKIGCGKLAEYEIWQGWMPGTDDYTDACLEHIPELLTDEPRHEIILIDGARGAVDIDAGLPTADDVTRHSQSG